ADLLRALEAGAWELIGLPLKLEILLLKLKAFARAKLELDHVREQSLIDERSGFYNTRGMVRRVNEIALDAARHHLPITCVVFAVEPEADVPLGADGTIKGGATSPEPAEPPAAPDSSDAITGRITERFRSTIRASDAVGRLGEREFVVLAPHTDPEGARRMAERITRSTISATSDEGMDVRFRVRAGCYAVSDFSAALVEPVEILMRATRALRRSQADLGRGPIEFYTEHPESTTSGNGG
ncbi:MAG: GGDEF domain-containing protein, partial [Longimicrobiales bacterium]